MNSLINWGTFYHHRFIIIVNFVPAEWKKKNPTVGNFIFRKVMSYSLPQ